ncbi:hypothetical protein EVAR_89780_1 [Eumeta japonica]|uniref:Mos1 transposase HTH domain-containing protein n=1 Tax=Eumeta variegata TaxID=151549 RepID=A0A4C1XF75_EUMVA|nr:hypothetical protein EVAR_89780_1 [Eumeta japonica]
MLEVLQQRTLKGNDHAPLSGRCRLRAYIQRMRMNGEGPQLQQSLVRFQTVFVNKAPSKATIYNWFEEFKRGHVNLSGELHDGRTFTAVNNKNMNAVHRMIETARHNQEENYVTWCNAMLTRFKEGASNLAWDIVTGVEKRIYCYDSKRKQQSSVWVYQDELKPTKVLQERSASK